MTFFSASFSNLRAYRHTIVVQKRGKPWYSKINRSLIFLKNRPLIFFKKSPRKLIVSWPIFKIYFPAALWTDILAVYYDLNGHLGEKITIDQLDQKFYWPGLANLRPRKAPQRESETPKGPWEILAWDLIGPLDVTEDHNKYILTGFDRLSKRAYAFPIASKHSALVASHIENVILHNPRVPRKILTGHGL